VLRGRASRNIDAAWQRRHVFSLPGSDFGKLGAFLHVVTRGALALHATSFGHF
jgi:hypothetical protein